MPPPPNAGGASSDLEGEQLASAVRDLLAWRENLADTQTPAGMLMQMAEAMRREEAHWRQRAETAAAERAAAESALHQRLTELGLKRASSDQLGDGSGNLTLATTQGK